RLLNNALRYAHSLQLLRRKEQDSYTSSDSHSDSTSHTHSKLEDYSDSDLSSLSSLNSLSSVSSLSSLELGTASESANTTEDEPSSDEELDLHYSSRLKAVREHIKYLSKTRVLEPNCVHKLSQLYLVLVLYKEYDPKRFRKNLRVAPKTFDELLKLISPHLVFTTTGTHEQIPVQEQLAVGLEFRQVWLCYAHVGLCKQFCRFMTIAEKEAAKDWVGAASCAAWQNGWLLVDGTLVPLAEKPGHHGEAYFDCKSNYSLNLITLPNLRIIDYVIGHCGSCHDSTAFAAFHTFCDHQQLLGPGEWIWADSAYPVKACHFKVFVNRLEMIKIICELWNEFTRSDVEVQGFGRDARVAGVGKAGTGTGRDSHTRDL
ncbi:hypothetical protein H0H93_014448, partial [Arthromyces matolae]